VVRESTGYPPGAMQDLRAVPGNGEHAASKPATR